ncbi:MAG: DUF374 domain-containing protein [Proteobacteria bacterium]|nr:DUF374 domain-containing protein [Pseudomonadota bacterium]
MKRLLRHGAVQTLLAVVVTAYLRLLFLTMRWRLEGIDKATPLVRGPEGMVVLFWHGRIVTAMACRRLLGVKPRFALVSLSRDGAFIAKAAEWVGVPTIRGSMANAAKAASKGGAEALRAMVRALRGGAAAIVTPDGPRGPNQRMSEGVVRLAQLSGAPVMLCGFAAAPAFAAGSWDQARFPLPFSRGVLVADGPWRVGEATEGDALEAVRVDWEARMRAAQSRADALAVGGGD